MKRTLLTLLSFNIILLILISLSSAQDYVFRQAQRSDLKVPCFNNGTSCGASAVCNATIIKPDNTILLQNVKMTNNGTIHNITLNPSQTSMIGNYKAIIVCSDAGNSGFTNFDILISPSGTDDNHLNQLILLALVIVIGGWLVAFGFSKNEAIFTIVGSFAFVGLGLYTLINGIGNYRNNLTETISLIVMIFSSYVALRSSWETITT